MARRFNRAPLSNDEREARRRADRDRLEQAARALLTTDGWQRWIRVRASKGLSRYTLIIWGWRVANAHAALYEFDDMSLRGSAAVVRLLRMSKRVVDAARVLSGRRR